MGGGGGVYCLNVILILQIVPNSVAQPPGGTSMT